jgi:hypothetical protein
MAVLTRASHHDCKFHELVIVNRKILLVRHKLSLDPIPLVKVATPRQMPVYALIHFNGILINLLRMSTKLAAIHTLAQAAFIVSTECRCNWHPKIIRIHKSGFQSRPRFTQTGQGKFSWSSSLEENAPEVLSRVIIPLFSQTPKGLPELSNSGSLSSKAGGFR